MVVTLIEAAAIGLVLAAFGVGTVLFYRFSNVRVIKKITSLKKSAEETQKALDRISAAKQGEIRELRKRIDSIEEKLDLLLLSRGDVQETIREKILAKSR